VDSRSREPYLVYYNSDLLTKILIYWSAGPVFGFYYAYGFLWVALVLSRPAWPPAAGRLVPVILVLILASLAATDVARNLSAGLPIIIAASLAWFRPLLNSESLRSRFLVGVLILAYWGAMTLTELVASGIPRKSLRVVFSGVGVVVVAWIELRKLRHRALAASGQQP
jgi:hypothetical protein